MEEEWRDVIGFENCYQVSSLGRVRSIKRKRRMAHERQRTVRDRILKIEVKGDGYCRVTLSLPTKRRREYVHRLVCEAFLSNPDNLPEVNHINGIRTDNKITNLEWCTRLENARNRIERQKSNFDQNNSSF